MTEKSINDYLKYISSWKGIFNNASVRAIKGTIYHWQPFPIPKCDFCGIEDRTYPLNIAPEFIDVFRPTYIFSKYCNGPLLYLCSNCAINEYGNPVWDCVRGEERILKPYRFYKIKKFLLKILVIFRIPYFLIWFVYFNKILYPIYKYRKEHYGK